MSFEKKYGIDPSASLEGEDGIIRINSVNDDRSCKSLYEDIYYPLYGHESYHEMMQFKSDNPFIEIDFSSYVRHTELIPGKSYISVYKKKMYNYEITDYEKKTMIQPVIYKEKIIEPEKQHSVYQNTFRYIFTDLYGEPYTYEYPSIVGNGHTSKAVHKINEFEFRHGMITLYEYTEGIPHFK
jgi:hypothetical protein